MNEIEQRLEQIEKELGSVQRKIAVRTSPEAKQIKDGLVHDLEVVRSEYRTIDLSANPIEELAKKQGKEDYILDLIKGFDYPETIKKALLEERDQLRRRLKEYEELATR